MLVGHFSTAMIANQKFPKGTLLFFLISSQIQDFLWFLLHYLGFEHTAPKDAFDATLIDMSVNMLYSHDLLPQISWMFLVYLVGFFIFKNHKIAFVGSLLILGHYVLDFFSGHPHYIFGEDSSQFGLGLYKSNPYLAVGIEVVFCIFSLWYFFNQEAKKGVHRTLKNKMIILGVFIYGIGFMLSTAVVSYRQIFGIPEFNLPFNTLIPTLIVTYVGLLWVLNSTLSKFEFIKKK